jgi:putative DNA primase/helicase
VTTTAIHPAVREVPFNQWTTLDAANNFDAVYNGAKDLGEVLPEIPHNQVLSLILNKLESCDFQKLGGFKNKEDIKQKQYVVLSIRQLLEAVKKQRYALARKNDFIFVYNGQYWREIDRDTLKDFLAKAVARLGVDELEAQHYEFIEKVYKQFLSAAHFEQVEADTSRVLINLRNGTFEISSTEQRLREFRASDFLRHQLPFAYDPEAKAPHFTAYLNRVVPEIELQHILAEYFGYPFTA